MDGREPQCDSIVKVRADFLQSAKDFYGKEQKFFEVKSEDTFYAKNPRSGFWQG